MSQNSKKRILVGLDLSSMDKHILSFLGTHANVLTDEKIHFIHVKEESSDASESNTENPLNLITQEIPNTLDSYEVHVQDGDPEEELKLLSEDKDIDLVVLGLKASSENEVEVKRLVRKPFYSMLLVPERSDYSFKKICVAVDFSELSKHLIQEADKLAKKSDARLIGFHSYQVPSGYHKSGKNHYEFAEVMEKNAREEAEAFLKKNRVDNIEMHYMYDENEQPAECIAEFSHNNDMDLVVLGSKGRTGAASVLIGSVAKKLTQILQDIPLLIIKPKDQNMDFVDALKKV